MTDAVLYLLPDRLRIPTLRSIVGKSRERGWRVAVRCSTEQEAKLVDDVLWRAPDDGFLPHARAGSGFDADQPVLIVTDADACNRPDALVLHGSFDVRDGEFEGLQRLCVLLDGTDAEQLNSARQLAEKLDKLGMPAEFWENEDGGWRRRQAL